MKTLEEIRKIREVTKLALDLRNNLAANSKEKYILVCKDTACVSSKSNIIIDNFRKLIVDKKRVF